jgi:hypothetical protein
VSAQFLYSEARAAKALGVNRDEIREIRELHLERNSDWRKIGRDILLTEAGLLLLIRFLVGARLYNSDLPRLSDCLPQKNGANGARKKMRVVAVPINPRMVLANDSGDPGQEQHLVYVGRNATFAFGDEIEVEPVPEQKGIWQLTSEVPRNRRRP